jgi:tellurite resistance protein
MSKRPRSKAMREVEVVANYVDQRDEHMMQALVTVGAFMAVADGQVQVAERDELVNFITRQGFVPASSKHDIAEAFDSRVRQFDGAPDLDALREALRPLTGLSLSSVVLRTAERVAAADRDLHSSEIEALRAIRRILANGEG